MAEAPSTPEAQFEAATVGQAMRRGIITCAPHTPLPIVASMMARERVHAIVVQDDEGESELEGPLWGVVSDLDLVAAAGPGFGDRTAAGCATQSPITVSESEALYEAARIMKENETAHLIVLDGSSALPVGVISTLDIARALAGGH